MNPHAPRFSIVVPSYNQGKFLDACLRSLIAQREEGIEVEILVMDGGSQDETLDVLDLHSSDLSFWRSSPDGGQSRALVEGFEIAQGDIFGWLNSDDVLAHGALARVANWFSERKKAVAVYGDAVWIDEDGAALKPKREIPFLWNIFAYGFCYLPQPSMFFRADAYRKSGGVDPTLGCSFDYDLWHRLAARGPIGHIGEILSLIRDHPGTKTNQKGPVFEQENRTIQTRYLKSRGLYRQKHLAALAARVGLKFVTGRYRRLSAFERDVVRRAQGTDDFSSQ